MDLCIDFIKIFCSRICSRSFSFYDLHYEINLWKGCMFISHICATQAKCQDTHEQTTIKKKKKKSYITQIEEKKKVCPFLRCNNTVDPAKMD